MWICAEPGGAQPSTDNEGNRACVEVQEVASGAPQQAILHSFGLEQHRGINPSSLVLEEYASKITNNFCSALLYCLVAVQLLDKELLQLCSN